MPSTEKKFKLGPKDWQTLLITARHAIKYGLTYKKAPKMELKKYSSTLQQPGASFVTLKESNVLRGCIGSLEAHQPLIQDVAEHAFAAAFKDPRFAPVNHIEEPVIHISISVLSPVEAMHFDSQNDLVSQIEAGKDGLILEYLHHKGTFLPSVWEQLPDKQEFLNHLKQKAGLSADFWSNEIKVSRYFTQTID
jgi:AmmeMemoRadiSam system protein A